jgi:hypothetical protein
MVKAWSNRQPHHEVSDSDKIAQSRERPSGVEASKKTLAEYARYDPSALVSSCSSRNGQ